MELVEGTRERGLEDVVTRAGPRWRRADLGSQIPAKEQLVVGHLVVDPGDRHVLVFVSGLFPLDFATRMRGLWQLRDEVQRRRAEEGRTDAVADERGAEVDLPSGALRRRDRRKVAGEHLGGRHLTQDGALVGAEEEELVADNRAAQRAAELIAPQAVVDLLAVGAERRKVLRGVEATIAQEFEAAPGETIRARLGYGIDRRA